MSIEYITGFIVGILIVAVVGLVVKKRLLKRSGGVREYDERQVAARGRAFAAAYFTLLIYLSLWMLLQALELPLFAGPGMVMLGMLLSITVFVCHAIFHDAYFYASDRPKIWLWIIGATGLMNLVIGIGRLVRGATPAEKLVENANLMVGGMTVVILACSLVKLAVDRRSEEE